MTSTEKPAGCPLSAPAPRTPCEAAKNTSTAINIPASLCSRAAFVSYGFFPELSNAVAGQKAVYTGQQANHAQKKAAH